MRDSFKGIGSMEILSIDMYCVLDDQKENENFLSATILNPVLKNLRRTFRR